LIAVNNRGFSLAGNPNGTYAGSNIAWIAGLRVGHPLLAKRGDWNVSFDYRSIGSDAVIDGFNGDDFGAGGTNMKGYTFSGNLALSSKVNLGLRWMSANEIAGPPLATDILQIDLNGKF
ncbi:MAG: putative porin, partial [Verrucomicrobia bacterium]|nr:putative porin [Verrucomicrobiota bacterium]